MKGRRKGIILKKNDNEKTLHSHNHHHHHQKQNKTKKNPLFYISEKGTLESKCLINFYILMQLLLLLKEGRDIMKTVFHRKAAWHRIKDGSKRRKAK